MRRLLLSLLLINSLFSFGQNWNFFQENDTVNFNKSDIHSIATDSGYSDSNGYHIPFWKILNDSMNHSAFGLFTITSPEMPNIFGKEILVRNDSNFFANQNGEQILLLNNSPLDSSWEVLQSSGKLFTAKVDSIYTDSVNGILDSIRKITFQCRDSAGNIVNHYIDTKKLVLSKKNGVLNTINWYQFPNPSYLTTYDINFLRVFVDLSLTKEEMYGYDVGDEFHLVETEYNGFNPAPFFPNDYSNHFILSKTLSPSGDSLIYTKRHKRDIYTVTLASPMGPVLYHYNFQTGVNNIIISNIKGKAIKALGKQVIIDSSGNLGSVNHLSVNYNGRIVQSYQMASYVNNYFGWSFAPYYVSNEGKEIEGICSFKGFDDWSNPGNRIYDIKSMVYFKKGTETWGTPRLVTSLDQPEIKIENSIYPNPTTGLTHLSGVQNLERVEVYDLSGKLMSAEFFSRDFGTNSASSNSLSLQEKSSEVLNGSNHQLDLSSYMPGIYFIKLILRDGSFQTVKVVKE